MKLVLIKPGTFTMGSPPQEAGHDETETAHSVTLTKPFWIGATVVTRRQFAEFVKGASYQTSAERAGRSIVHTDRGVAFQQGVTWWTAAAGEGDDKMPVIHVSDEDAMAFCRWISERSGRKVRLPTEAEWEYACRSGTTTPFAGELDEMGWYAGNSGDAPLDCGALVKQGNEKFLKAIVANHCRLHAVAQKKPNAWGVYDMHGNVWQWCSDVYALYTPGAATDPTGPRVEAPKWRCARCGDWANIPTVARSANRGNWRPGQSYDMVGFRVVVESD